MRILLEEIRTGTRTINNTDWPIEDQLHRTGEREWTITRDLCNGTARSAETYRSESKAREAFDQRLDGRKPRAGAAADRKVTIRLTADEAAKYEAAAALVSQSLSEWLRAAAELAVARGSTR